MIIEEDTVLLSQLAREYGSTINNFYTFRDKIHEKKNGSSTVPLKKIEEMRNERLKADLKKAFKKCTNLKGYFHLLQFLYSLGMEKKAYQRYIYDVDLLEVEMGRRLLLYAKPIKGGVIEKLINLEKDGFHVVKCEKDDEYMDEIVRISGKTYIGAWK